MMRATIIKMRGVAAVPRRRFNNEVLKPTFLRMGETWGKEVLPTRFSGGSRAGFSPRKDSYNRQKKKRVGHNQPLVLTGQLKKAALSAFRIDATFKGNKCRLPNARKANLRHPNSTIDMRAEIGFVSRLQRRKIVRAGKRRLVERTNSIRATKTVRA